MGKGRKIKQQNPRPTPSNESPQSVAPQGKKEAIVTSGKTIVQAEQSFKGPIPPPSTLKEYGEIKSDFPERIMASWEKEQAHRREKESELIRNSYIVEKRGQIMAFILTILSLGITILLILEGEYVAGSFVAGISFFTIILGTNLFNYFIKLFGKREDAPDRD